MPDQAPNIDTSGSGPLVYDKERRAIVRANPVVSAGNYLAFVEAGMSETAAQRFSKQWDEKCAEVDNLTRFVDFANLWCNRTSKISDGERVSVIKYHPVAQKRLKAQPID